ncbi:hypothetical protein ACFRJ1_30845 [Streptomyces sp. NPDC056773]|uniref:hypothetical protein n=1 Tax=unclassified Streptomyces TaxID=2593676 RepID=UPI0036A288AA
MSTATGGKPIAAAVGEGIAEDGGPFRAAAAWAWAWRNLDLPLPDAAAGEPPARTRPSVRAAR